MKKLKHNHIMLLATLAAITTAVLLSIIFLIIEHYFNINTNSNRLLVGWFSASAYFITIIKLKYSNKINTVYINKNDYDTLVSNLKEYKQERDIYKNELEYIKTKYDKLISETIVKRNIK